MNELIMPLKQMQEDPPQEYPWNPLSLLCISLYDLLCFQFIVVFSAKEYQNQQRANKETIKKTYATMTISSPKAAVLWYEFEALSPATHTEVYQHQSKNKFIQTQIEKLNRKNKPQFKKWNKTLK